MEWGGSSLLLLTYLGLQGINWSFLRLFQVRNQSLRTLIDLPLCYFSSFFLTQYVWAAKLQ